MYNGDEYVEFHNFEETKYALFNNVEQIHRICSPMCAEDILLKKQANSGKY